jgi:hypothetical protein
MILDDPGLGTELGTSPNVPRLGSYRERFRY